MGDMSESLKVGDAAGRVIIIGSGELLERSILMRKQARY
jgi:hypothetical protein